MQTLVAQCDAVHSTGVLAGDGEGQWRVKLAAALLAEFLRVGSEMQGFLVPFVSSTSNPSSQDQPAQNMVWGSALGVAEPTL